MLIKLTTLRGEPMFVNPQYIVAIEQYSETITAVYFSKEMHTKSEMKKNNRQLFKESIGRIEALFQVIGNEPHAHPHS
ncbi:flagellar FlbD family protein [Entomospira entomophila]|uniref:Flagellar FlbD family protein n=1 Tax=Entomospira entomophila TaxID=2719988 RepID=A0A968KT95_9SPIO|nr:flagellar FlbD family protein [Entomospira entomophilus]NIZ40066.1 flagellar FlbD family protein [Entomospira entomophilus]WDI35627.1 flagellar FlbD family protein [Entomospira entomophilus]